MKGYDATNSREHCNSISSGDGGRRRSDAYSLQSGGRGCDAIEGGYHGTGAKDLGVLDGCQRLSRRAGDDVAGGRREAFEALDDFWMKLFWMK